jgi:hypothetical protein
MYQGAMDEPAVLWSTGKAGRSILGHLGAFSGSIASCCKNQGQLL